MRLHRTLCLLILALPVFAQDPQLKIPEAEAKRAAIEKPAPVYSTVARQLKVVGRVVVDAIVGADGKVEDVRIVTGNPILTKPVVEAVKKWRFTPFKVQGEVARAVANLSFDFRQ